MTALDHNFDVPNVDDRDIAEQTDDSGKTSWIDQYSVAAKLRGAIVVNTSLMALVTLVILGASLFLGSAGQQQTLLNAAEARTAHAAIAVADSYGGLRDFSERGQVNGLQESARRLDIAREDVREALEFGGADLPPAIRSQIEGFRQRISGAQLDVENINGTTTVAEVQAIENEVRTLYQDMGDFASELHSETRTSAAELLDTVATSSTVFAALFILAVLGSIVIARVVISNVVGMIANMTESMQSIASGNTNAEIPGASRTDEIGDMARALQVFRKDSVELRDIHASRVRDTERALEEQQKANAVSAQRRAEQGAMLDNLANGFEARIGEVISAVGTASAQLEDASEQMVVLADGSAQQSRDATFSMEQANSNITAAAAATDQFALSITEISRQAASSAKLARDASTLADTANGKMESLSAAAEEIGEIVEMIQSIAQRTNLLALNASIEAARGGEAGRGFAVVASEVKELAHQTSQATSSVTDKITAMQDSTKSSVGDLSSIVKQIEELEQTSVMIASAVDEQSVSGEELARNIDTVAKGSDDVARQLKMLSESSITTGTVSSEVLQSAKALNSQAESLLTNATDFISEIRKSSRELEDADDATNILA